MAPKIVKKFLSITGIESEQQRRQRLQNDLIKHEARIGGTLFGPLHHDSHREFFCLDEHTWIWHEEWCSPNGKKQVQTTKYSVMPSGVVKSQNGDHYQRVSNEEAIRLLDAARVYKARVKNEIYQYAT